MKTRYILTLALGAMTAFACNKAEIDTVEDIQEVNNGGLYEIKAEIVNTKTAYDELGHFSWATGDKFSCVVWKEATAFNRDKFTLSTGAGTNSATFSGAISSGWNELGVALYPHPDLAGGIQQAGTYNSSSVDKGLQISKPQEITPNLSSPLSIVPMIGRKNAQGYYQFKTAVGILKVTITDIPADARYLYLEDPNKTFSFSGKFNLNGLDEISEANAVYTDNNDYKTTIAFTPEAVGETRTFYIPVPTGTVPVGVELKLDTGSSVNIVTKTFTKAVTVTANHVTPLKSFAAESWSSVGTGLFMDDNGFYATGYYSRGSGDADYISVEIEQHSTDATRYRVVNPYQAYITAKSKSLAADPLGPSPYLYFTLEDGYVSFENYQTGLYYYSSSYGQFYFADPAAYSKNKWNNCVINYDVDGVTPLNIQLSPEYVYNNGGYVDDCCENPKIEIVFPTSSRMLTCDNYPNTVSATRSSSKVYTFSWSSGTISGIEAAVASSENDAVAAIKSGAASVKSTSSSDTALTFDNILAEGTYYLVYKIGTSGHGWTYKSTSFYYGLGDAADVAGSYIGATKLVIAAADDKVGYNVKITTFLDHTFESPLYGIYQDGTITISASDWSTTPLYNDGEKDHYMGVTGSSTTTAASPYSDIVITVPNAGRVTASGYRIGVGTISGSTFTLDGGQYYTNLAANRL